MPDARVVTTPAPVTGNVMCIAQRIDDAQFPDASRVGFAAGPGGVEQDEVAVVQADVDSGTALFFVATPPGETDAFDQLVLPDTGDTFSLESPLTGTADALEIAQALRNQMQALAQAAQAFISEQRAAEAPDDETASTCAAVVGDGILRLAGSLEAAAPEPDSPQAADFDAAVAAIVAENQASLDALFATFPPPNVA